MAKKDSSKTQKENRAVYKKENRAKTNKVLKLQRHLKSHPDDAQSQDAFSKLESSKYVGRSKALRSKSRLVGSVSLQTLDGRLSTSGKLYQRLLKLKRAGLNQAKHMTKKEREFIVKIKDEFHRQQYLEQKRQQKAQSRRDARKASKAAKSLA